MNLSLGTLLSELQASLALKGLIPLHIIHRPWGAFLTFPTDKETIQKFLQEFFDVSSVQDLPLNRLAPKILIVAPKQRLSLQYHKRRREKWRVIKGPISAIYDTTGEVHSFNTGEEITIDVTVPHRLIGGPQDYAQVAEIWEHTDPENLSDEDDIVRLEDDYHRV